MVLHLLVVTCAVLGCDARQEAGLHALWLCQGIAGTCAGRAARLPAWRMLARQTLVTSTLVLLCAQWSHQGVFLLNAVLTVRAHDAASHGKRGWEALTDAAISALSRRRSGLVFLLWGRFAQQKRALVDTGKHHILTAAHPSGFSANKVCVCVRRAQLQVGQRRAGGKEAQLWLAQRLG